MKDEFPSYGKEYSNNIPEFQNLRAVKYYATQEENKDTAGEASDSNESSADDGNINKVDSSQKNEEKNYEDYDSTSKFRNNADGTKSPDTTSSPDSANVANGNGGETLGDGGALEAEAASGSASASSGASASGASAGASASTAASTTVASLAGSASVVAIAAVAVTTIATGIVHAAPTLVSEAYTKGTDYLTYEIKLKEITPEANYVIRVSGNEFSAEYPLDLETEIEIDEKDNSPIYVQRQIVTGLNPYTPYTVDVLEKYGEKIEQVYFSKSIVTDTLPMPKTVFQFTPKFNFDEGNFDILYDIFVSDFYKTSTDFVLQMYSGENLLVDDHNIGKDKFFRGVLEGLTDLSYLEATVYCTYYDFENTVIGEYGYRPEYPEDFIVTPSYQSTYDIKAPSVTYNDEGYGLSIDTGFVPQSDEDSYIIDIYKAEEKQANSLVADEKVLLATYEGRDKVIDVKIPGNINDIEIYFTGVKTKGDKKTKFDTKKIYSYSFAEDKKKAPKPTATITFEEDYDTIDDIYNVNYNVNVTDIFNTGSNIKVVELIDNEVVNEIALDKNEYKSSFNTLPNGVNIAVIIYSNYNDEEEQIIIGSDEKKIEYPEPFKDIEYLFKKDSYSLSLAYSKEDANKTFNLNIVQNNVDKTKVESNYEFVDVLNYEGTLDGVVMSEVESFNFTITYKDNIIKRLLVYPNGSAFEVGDISADEDGNIIIPYEISIPTGAEFDSAKVSFNGSEEVFELNKAEGTIKLTSFDSNILKPTVEIKYVIDDSIVTAEMILEDINIGADYEVSYYASHYNSYYNYINIRFDSKLDGKNVNINMAPMITADVDSNIEYINIDDRSLEGLTSGMYQNYYIVSAIQNGDDFGISYKVTNEGFDQTEHSITINQNLANDNELNNYSAGYYENGEAYIKYAKTSNEDGTVNYYFNTEFNELSANHYGRIEYSYTEDNVTKYLYSDFYNTKTISLLNVKDREYEFKYAVYYLDNNTYYDLDLLSGNGKTYDAKEIKITGVENDTTAIAKLKTMDDEERIVIYFELYDSNIDKSKPITLTYNDTVYTINLPEKATPGADGVMTEDGTPLEWTSTDGNYGYTALAVDDIYRVEAYMKVSAITGDIPFTAKLDYYAIANDFINEFDEMVGKESLEGDTEMIIGEYTGKYSTENVEVTHTNATLDTQATITVSGIHYTCTDSRDLLMVVAYANGEMITSDIFNEDSVTLNIDPVYTKVTVKLVECKNEYVGTINAYQNMEIYSLEYKTTLLDEIEFDKVQIIKNVSVFEDIVDEENTCIISITPDIEAITSFDGYNMGVTYYYDVEGDVSSEEIEDIESGTTEANITLHDKPVKVKVYVYKTDYYDNKVIYDSIEVPFTTSITFGTVDVNDDGYVILPYELQLPEDATLLTGADISNIVTFTGSEEEYTVSGLEGNITIKEIENNILHPALEVNYSYNNVNVYQRVFADDIDLGAECVVSYYASHYNSAYDTVNIKFDTTIGGKNVNSKLDVEVGYTIESEAGYTFVKLEEREAPSQTVFDNGYYVVKTREIIQVDDQQGTYSTVGAEMAYKIMSEGFDQTEHKVRIDSTMNQYTEANLLSYQAGYISDAEIDYVKTTNSDGTVNYYFNTGFDEKSSGHYGVILYSYKTDDGITRYLRSANSTGVIKLENIADKDYEFIYQVFYTKDSIDYDVDAVTSSGASQKAYYKCKEKSAATTLDLYNASIGIKQVDRTSYSTAVMFDIEPDNIDKNTPIVVDYAGKSITVEYKDYDPDDETMRSLGDGAYQYGWVSSDTTLTYVVSVRTDVIEVEACFTGLAEAPNTATVTFDGGPNDFVALYTELNNTNDIINYQSLSGEATVTVGAYTGSYDIEQFTPNTSGDNLSYNTITIEATGFTKKDERDSLIATAYYNGNKVAEAGLEYGQFVLHVDPAYTSVDVKILEVKNQEFTCQTLSSDNDSFSSYQIRYNEVDYQTFTFNQAEILDSISVSEEESNLTINVTPNVQFEDYYLKVEQFYKATSASNITNIMHTGDAGGTSIEFNKQYQTTKAILYIYNKPYYGDDRIIAMYELVFDATIGDYVYNDNDDYISLPVEVIIPEKATLDTTNTSARYKNQDPLFFDSSGTGNIRINSLDSNVVDLSFNIQYTLKETEESTGTVVSYSFTKKHEIESDDVSLDYAVYSVYGNSSYGGFSRMNVKYDESTSTVYYEKDGSYYDSDGNEAPSNLDSKFMYNTMYYIKGDLKTNIGCFTNLPYSGSYTISVQKAGGNIIDTSTGTLRDGNNLNSKLANELSTYTEQSSDVAGIYITFLHSLVGSTYDSFDVHGVSRCEMEFEIFHDGKAIVSKSIAFDEVDSSTIPGSDSFELDRATANSTITKNQDDSINMTINTGFDSTAHPNYVYTVELYEKTDYYGNDSLTKLYESNYTSTAEVQFTNIKNTNYEVYVTVYNVQDGSYIKYDSYNIGRANSPIDDYESSYSSTTGMYFNKYYIDTNYINPDYLTGTKGLQFKDGTIDLSNTSTSQSVASCTVTVTDQGNGIYLVDIESSSTNARRGNLVIEQGNSTIGYIEITYSI